MDPLMDAAPKDTLLTYPGGRGALTSYEYVFNPLNPEIKSHLLFAGIIRSSLFSPR